MPHPIWSPELSTGLDAMDDLHFDFCEAMAKASSVPDSDFCNAYASLVRTAERAFATEEQWMEEIGCPVLRAHREQHARVLGALHTVHSAVMGGELATGRKVVEHLLPEWFSMHGTTMNMALAQTIQVAHALHAAPQAFAAYADA